jgi:hypothetical protein
VALAWLLEDREPRCRCGVPVDEATDPKYETDWTAEVRVCHACAARERAERPFHDAGVYHVVTAVRRD